MAFDGTDPAWCLALPLTRTSTQRLKVAQFGDGYQQRMLDGINSLTRKWSVSAEMKPASVIAAMDDYLAGQRGRAFPFRDPASGKTFQVFCDEWEIEWRKTNVVNGAVTALYGTLSAEFSKANGVTI
jgi:phage-related protein